MANITRYTPFDDLFNEFTKGFWVKPLAMPAGTEVNIEVDPKGAKAAYKDCVLTLSLPKKGNGGGKRITVA